jgi:hypothetical protein
MNVAKVDQHVAMVCILMLQAFVPCVLSVFSDVCCKYVLFGCRICFTHILQVFYLDVAFVCNGFQVFFKLFLQVLYLRVLKIVRMLHMIYASWGRPGWHRPAAKALGKSDADGVLAASLRGLLLAGGVRR